MSEIHEVYLEEEVKKILDHVWQNVKEKITVKDTENVNVETVHAVISVANVDSVTPVKTECGHPSQTPVRDSVLASMMKDLTTSPTDLEISGIHNISTFTGTPMYSELEGEGCKGEDSSPSSESAHRVQTESSLDNFVPTQSIDAENISKGFLQGYMR